MGLKLIEYYKVVMKMFPETKNPATAGAFICKNYRTALCPTADCRD